MKIPHLLLFAIVFVLVPQTSLAQTTFEQRTLIEQSLDLRSITDVIVIDFNCDGDQDILSLGKLHGDDDYSLVWQENIGGLNYEEHIIDLPSGYWRKFDVGDFDGDQDNDIILISSSESRWIESIGNNEFQTHNLTGTLQGASDVFSIDIDGDDDIDLLVGSASNERVSWYKNNGAGSFSEQVVINDILGVGKVFAVDIDLDGDIDLFSLQNGLTFIPNTQGVKLYLNDGRQHFDVQEISNLFLPNDIAAADLDGDGALDLVLASAGSVHQGEITGFRNNNMIFEPYLIMEDFRGTDIVEGVATAVSTADIDGDGDIDVLAGTDGDYGPTLAWLKNNGNSQFSLHEVEGVSGRTSNVHAFDADNDGTVDLLSQAAGKINVHTNNGSQVFAAEKVLGQDGITKVEMADINGDEYLDIVAVVWPAKTLQIYLNDGHGEYKAHSMGETVHSVDDIHVTDIDLDGDNDLVVANSVVNDIWQELYVGYYWFENNGTGEFVRHRFNEFYSPIAKKIYSGDLDCDGDVDIVINANQDILRWYKNNGSQEFARYDLIGSERPDMQIVDMNADGDLDIVTTDKQWKESKYIHNLTYFRNECGGNFSYEVLDELASFATAIHVLDFDLDGDQDILTVINQGKLVLHENADSLIFTDKEIDATLEDPSEVAGVDLDNDGLMDIVVGSHINGNIDWYQNNAESGFEKNSILSESNQFTDLIIVDLEQDDDLDLITTSTKGGNSGLSNIDLFQNMLLSNVNHEDNVFSDMTGEIPLFTRLQYNYPNPFSQQTTVNYELSLHGQVEIVIYDQLGRIVYVLVDYCQPAGGHQITWNGTDQAGNKLEAAFTFIG